MKSDLATSVIVFVVGAGIAYFACNMMLPPIKSVTVETIQGDSNYNIDDPNNEIFNYRAINPTVEVYIGDCTDYDSNGNCIMDNNNATPEEENEENREENEENQEENEENQEENQENTNPEEEPENGPTN